MDSKAFELFNEIVDRLIQSGLTEAQAVRLVSEFIEAHEQMEKELDAAEAAGSDKHIS